MMKFENFKHSDRQMMLRIRLLSRTGLVRSCHAREVTARSFASRTQTKEFVQDDESYSKQHLYPERDKFVQSSTEVVEAIGRPIPINAELNRYAPFKHKPTHSDLVAQVQFRSFEHKQMDFFVNFALRVAFYLKIPVVGPSFMPKRIERWTVIKSPFVHAKSKQNFERITYRRMFKLYDANPEVVQIFLSTLSKYSIGGVGIDAKLFSYESLDFATKLDTPLLEDSPLNLNKINLKSVDQKLADTVLKILKDPVFEQHLSTESLNKLVGKAKKASGERKEKQN